ncbi:hypothetical protein J6590_065262 [Homalodisca vitripennis]|nr:hypothetical protein J6590_065262 [Homalodisca vitripennis]
MLILQCPLLQPEASQSPAEDSRHILPPTRIKPTSMTSIDNVCINLGQEEINVEVLNTGISDHTGQLCTISKSKNTSSPKMTIERRDMSNTPPGHGLNDNVQEDKVETAASHPLNTTQTNHCSLQISVSGHKKTALNINPGQIMETLGLNFQDPPITCLRFMMDNFHLMTTLSRRSPQIRSLSRKTPRYLTSDLDSMEEPFSKIGPIPSKQHLVKVTTATLIVIAD